MRIVKLDLLDFASHERTALEFKESDRLVLIQGLNGSGKSYLMDAIPWAIYGKIQRDGMLMRPKQLIRDGCEAASVILTLDDDTWIVRSTSDLSFTSGGVKLTKRKRSQTQQTIEKHLGFNFNSFMSACYISQGTVGKFVNGRSSDRIKILTDVLSLDVIDRCVATSAEKYRTGSVGIEGLRSRLEWIGALLKDTGDAEELSEDIQENKDEIRLLDRKIKSVNRKIGMLRERERLQRMLTDLKRDYDSKDGNLRLRLETMIAKIEEIKDRNTEFRKAAEDTLLLEQKIGGVEVIIAENGEVVKRDEAWKKGYFALKAQEEQINSEIEGLEVLLSSGGVCPTCGRSVKSGHNEIKGLLREKTVRLKSTETKLANHYTKKKSISIDQRRISDARNSLQDLLIRLERSQNIEKELKILIGREQQLRDESKELARHRKTESKSYSLQKRQILQNIKKEAKGDLKDLEEQRSGLQEKNFERRANQKIMIENLDRARRLTEERDQIKVDTKKAETRLFYYDYWSKRFPQLKYALIDSFIPQMEQEANEILSAFTSIRVRMVTSVEKESGGAMDRFNITVYSGRWERAWESWSGGEKKQVALAICCAMNNVLYSMGLGLDFILMDEVFSDLDIQKRPLVLDHLVKSGRRVFVISHTDINQSYFDRVLTIEKQSDVSIVNG